MVGRALRGEIRHHCHGCGHDPDTHGKDRHQQCRISGIHADADPGCRRRLLHRFPCRERCRQHDTLSRRHLGEDAGRAASCRCDRGGAHPRCYGRSQGNPEFQGSRQSHRRQCADQTQRREGDGGRRRTGRHHQCAGGQDHYLHHRECGHQACQPYLYADTLQRRRQWREDCGERLDRSRRPHGSCRSYRRTGGQEPQGGMGSLQG